MSNYPLPRCPSQKTKPYETYGRQGDSYREAYGLGVGMPDCGTQMTVMGFNYGTGTYQDLDRTAWGCTQSGFEFWWMSNMPGPFNRNGALGTRLKNWWTKVAQ